MLSSDWLMKGVFFLPILRFFSFSTIAGIFAAEFQLFVVISFIGGGNQSTWRKPSYCNNKRLVASNIGRILINPYIMK
jgi:hypothetical protein